MVVMILMGKIYNNKNGIHLPMTLRNRQVHCNEEIKTTNHMIQGIQTDLLNRQSELKSVINPLHKGPMLHSALNMEGGI
jgi:hypothetical protein